MLSIETFSLEGFTSPAFSRNKSPNTYNLAEGAESDLFEDESTWMFTDYY